MYNKKYVGSRLQEIRKSHKKQVSANQLSIDLDCSPTTISKIETGKAYPSFDLFFKICDYFQIEPAAFFGKTDFNSIELSSQEIEILKNTKNLTPLQLEKLNDFIKAMYK